MSAHAYSKERIVEQPAVALFAEMGWRTANAMEHLSEEELTIFNVLTRPGPDLTAEEREESRR